MSSSLAHLANSFRMSKTLMEIFLCVPVQNADINLSLYPLERYSRRRTTSMGRKSEETVLFELILYKSMFAVFTYNLCIILILRVRLNQNYCFRIFQFI